MLRYLVDHPGRLVSQDELLEAIWPETYVQPEVLRTYIQDLRKILGDSPKDPLYIETLPKRGYQFIAAIANHSAPKSAAEETVHVGRERELAELDSYLYRASGGQRQIVFVTGEAGIGKSTLIDTFEQRLGGRADMRVIRGQCMEGFGGKEAYYPFLDAFGQLVRGSGSEQMIQTLASHAPAWLMQFPSFLKPEQREALQREILGATRERMVREICQALEVLTAETPLVLILEDLHWGDPSTLDLISALARRRNPAKLMLVGTYRPVEVILLQSPLKTLKQDLVLHKLCSEVALERLAETQVAEYLSAEFPAARLPEGLAALIHRQLRGESAVHGGHRRRPGEERPTDQRGRPLGTGGPAGADRAGRSGDLAADAGNSGGTSRRNRTARAEVRQCHWAPFFGVGGREHAGDGPWRSRGSLRKIRSAAAVSAARERPGRGG